MKNDSIYYLKKLKEKYLLQKSGEILLLSLAASCFVFGLTSFLNISLSPGLIIAASTGAIVFATLFLRLKLHRFDKSRLIVFINHHYPVMQHSTDLLFKDPRTLTSLQQIQKEKTRPHFEQIFMTIKLPHQMGKALIFLGTSIVLTGILFFFSPDSRSDPRKKNESALVQAGSSASLPASVKELIVKVHPPAYTGVASYTTKEPNISIPEGSLVRWEIVFTDTVQDPALIFLRDDSLRLSRGQQQYRAERSFSQSNIYQLSWQSVQGSPRTSAYYKAEVIHDQPPGITIPQQPEYIEINPDDRQSVPLKVNLSDDYGLKDAYVIATVSKGSGESVRFREEKLTFASPAKINGRRSAGSRIIDLKDLGMEPGDELYFYVEALDNKIPSANRARTQTYFITLQDTSSQILSAEAGLSVDLMPAYFRSQRQIITDSEKLLREGKALSQQEFNSRSNEIGYDQKVLRLKYGEFLGEEFETNIGGGGEPSEAEEEEEHHAGEGEAEDPTEAYKHIHDDPEEATFFTQSIRSKLKAALTAMWDAELHLRTFNPKKSLPYQYTALRLLKDISQDSRIYAHKTGFEPPPVKEEKRLTGDLSEIKTSAYSGRVPYEETYPGIRSALGIIEEQLVHPDTSKLKFRQALLRAGQELAVLALEEPGNYLHALSVIKSLRNEEIPPKETLDDLLFLRKVFWSILPKEMASPAQSFENTHSLDRAFIDHLKPLKND